jgi:hypothetical protein
MGSNVLLQMAQLREFPLTNLTAVRLDSCEQKLESKLKSL